MVSSGAAAYGAPETRRRILAVTWQLLEKRGSGVRLADVAASAGVSRQAVYLHFGDRAGLLIAVVEHIDDTIGVDALMAPVFDAPTGAQALERMVEALAVAAPQIDAVARVLEAAEREDAALGAAFRNRMARRRAAHRQVIQRIADEGQLAEGWSVDAATDLFYVLAAPGPWRELIRVLGWTPEQYVDHVSRLLRDSLLAPAARPNGQGEQLSTPD